MENWEARIVERPDMMKNALYIAHKTLGGRVYLTPNGEVLYKDGAVPNDDPYLALLDDEQLAAFAEAAAKSGVKTRPQHQLEGTLAAQSAHLEDMRTLVFRGKK